MRVRGYRTMLGLTQEQISKLIGISKQSYSLKERGRIKFSDNEKVKLKKLFKEVKNDITIDEIFLLIKLQKNTTQRGGLWGFNKFK
nr:helix-turn-helix domain-containing protein [Enterococcus durans]